MFYFWNIKCRRYVKFDTISVFRALNLPYCDSFTVFGLKNCSKQEMFYFWNIKSRTYKKSETIFVFPPLNLPQSVILATFCPILQAKFRFAKSGVRAMARVQISKRGARWKALLSNCSREPASPSAPPHRGPLVFLFEPIFFFLPQKQNSKNNNLTNICSKKYLSHFFESCTTFVYYFCVIFSTPIFFIFFYPKNKILKNLNFKQKNI